MTKRLVCILAIAGAMLTGCGSAEGSPGSTSDFRQECENDGGLFIDMDNTARDICVYGEGKVY
jgi:hypothetical protein